jgi:exodeoxyribonuclease V gamma subunit
MDYMEQNYTLETRDDSTADIIDHLTTHHRLQPFHPDYFRTTDNLDHEKMFSFSRENSDAAVALATRQLTSAEINVPLLPPPPDEYRQVTIQELVMFYAHPVRYLLRKRIGIAPIEESQALNTSEPFEIKGLERYILEHDILEQINSGGDCESLYQVKKAAGQLPHGRMGKVYFSQLVSEVYSFREVIDTLSAGQQQEKLEIALDVDGFRIAGHLDSVGAAGMVQFRYATIKPKDVIRSWICHLILNRHLKTDVPESMKHTFLAGKDKTFEYLPVTENSFFLEQLLSLYWLGLTQPLHFFPRASFAFALAVHNGKSEGEAMLRAAGEWEGNMHTGPGEKHDPYNFLCFKNTEISETTFADLAKKIFLPALVHRVTNKR